METYSNYISQFEIFESPKKKKGLHRHHIVPQEIQKKLYGKVIDNRQVYLTWSQHFWVHILYDREHDTNTADLFLKACNKTKDFFDCYAKCLAYTYRHSKKEEVRRQNISMSQSGKHHTDESKKKMSESHSGNKNNMYGTVSPVRGKHWFHNESESVMAFICPEGFVPGMLRKH